MKKLAIIAIVAVGLVAFIGTDVVKTSVGSVRTAVRGALTKDVPLPNQLAEARAQVDAYAESIIRGEVAAENLRDMIAGVEREVRALSVRVERERNALAMLRDGMSGAGGAVPVALAPEDPGANRQALRRVHAFQATNELLSRRSQDLERLRGEYQATLASLEAARTEQGHLGEEIRVLAAELESLNARKAAARTRSAVGDSSIASSGFANAQERIQRIRSTLREQNKLLQYYEYERVGRADAGTTVAVERTTDPVTAIEEALAAYPGR